MTIKIKLILAAGALLIGALLAWYVQGLRADNDRLTTDNARLLAVNAANVAVIQGLESQTLQTDKALARWAEEKATLIKTQERLTAQIKRELQDDENFKAWYDADLPYNAVGLLNFATGD